ncbi:MAG: DDE-type integrase/transposase/recombinase, partial [Burkholderiaceae bacterium]|nr:DDE-type integrase/transposase/recombinase [Burkholderiaceae bacterium]
VFKEENERRVYNSDIALRIPGREAVRQFIKRLDKFRVLVARYGQSEAMKRMRPVNEGIEVSRPFERVEMDEWKIDLLTIMAKSGLLALFSKEELKALDLLDKTKRWWLVTAIDCRTRCIVGMTLTADPKTSSALKCLRMVVSDKAQFADAVGALSSWSIYSTPELLAVDNGSAFKSALFTSTCADLGIAKLQTIGGHRFLNSQGGSAIKAITAHRGELERLTQVIFRRRQPAVGAEGQAHLHETLARCLAHFWREEAAFDRQHMDARGIRRRRFVPRGDVKHRNLLPARLHGAHVVDGRAVCFVDHNYTVNALRKAFKANSSSPAALASMPTGPE